VDEEVPQARVDAYFLPESVRDWDVEEAVHREHH